MRCALVSNVAISDIIVRFVYTTVSNTAGSHAGSTGRVIHETIA